VVAPDVEISDIDLDEEVVPHDDTRLTEARASRTGEEALSAHAWVEYGVPLYDTAVVRTRYGVIS
jgi:hypothetical protein